MADKMDGQDRVNRRESNNRRGSRATGPAAKTPRKSGAQRMFRSNPMKGGGINRPLKGSQ